MSIFIYLQCTLSISYRPLLCHCHCESISCAAHEAISRAAREAFRRAVPLYINLRPAGALKNLTWSGNFFSIISSLIWCLHDQVIAMCARCNRHLCYLSVSQVAVYLLQARLHTLQINMSNNGMMYLLKHEKIHKFKVFLIKPFLSMIY